MVLTEQEPSPLLAKVTATADESRERAVAAASPPPAIANAPVASAAIAWRAIVVNTISWVDPVTRRRYSLSGPVSVEELEAIKARLLQTKR